MRRMGPSQNRAAMRFPRIPNTNPMMKPIIPLPLTQYYIGSLKGGRRAKTASAKRISLVRPLIGRLDTALPNGELAAALVHRAAEALDYS
jgi:hypothetical protein